MTRTHTVTRTEHYCAKCYRTLDGPQAQCPGAAPISQLDRFDPEHHAVAVDIEEGVIWERVTTSSHGAAEYSYEAGDGEQEDRRFRGALRRCVGRTVSHSRGHYGHAVDGGGLSPLGSYTVERI